MGQNRTDTANQRAAKARVADRRKCPRCLRRAALSTPIRDDVGTFRECLYCGHQVGTYYGASFGRDVTPEPGTRTPCVAPKEQNDG